MLVFVVSEAWQDTYPDASVGILAMRRVANPPHHPPLEERKGALEQQLRQRFAGADRAAIKALPAIAAYTDYYRRFRKTYHVQLQLESVVLKGKAIPSVAALVESMFMAELKNMLLTAGHDLETVRMPVRIEVAQGTEQMVCMNGQEQQLKAGDMMIADVDKVLSSVIYGPDRRAQIMPETSQVLFTVYAPGGIEREAVRAHLEDIRDYVWLVTPEAEVLELQVYG